VHAKAAITLLSLLVPVLSPATATGTSTAPALPAATALPVPPAPPELHLPRGGLELGTLAAPALVLAGLAGAALFLLRRRRAPGRRVQVLETTSLGPKRSLVLARLRNEVLLLGASEAGITLLRAQPASELELAEAEPEPADPPARGRRPADRPAAPLSGLVARLRNGRPDLGAGTSFETLLAESAEDQELRRKLARGQAGSVR
jgi:flagellar protein FliO/FliZ